MVENIRNRLLDENESDEELSKSSYEERIEMLEQQLKKVLEFLPKATETAHLATHEMNVEHRDLVAFPDSKQSERAFSSATLNAMPHKGSGSFSSE